MKGDKYSMQIKLLRKRCPFCRHWFTVHRRLKERQIACFNQECQQKSKKNSQRQWLKKNRGYFKDWYNYYLKGWLSKHPGYLKEYRRQKNQP